MHALKRIALYALLFLSMAYTQGPQAPPPPREPPAPSPPVDIRNSPGTRDIHGPMVEISGTVLPTRDGESLPPKLVVTLCGKGGEYFLRSSRDKFKFSIPVEKASLVIVMVSAEGRRTTRVELGPDALERYGYPLAIRVAPPTEGGELLPEDPPTPALNDAGIPVEARHQFQLALKEIAKFNFEKGVAYLAKAAEIYPPFAEAYIKSGTILLHTGMPVAAEAAFLKALEIKPDSGCARRGAELARGLSRQAPSH